MKDTPVFDDVPEFSPDGTNVKPGPAKYSGGWVSGEILPFDYANWLFNGLTKNGVVGGESLASVHAELKAILTLFGLAPSDLSDSQIANYFASHGLQYGYDIVIDSDAKLDEWAQCTDGSLKRVLIKAGTWTASALGPTAGVLINLDATGTNYVFAEPGSLIEYGGSYSGNMYGLYHATRPTGMNIEQFSGVKISISNAIAHAYGIYRCTNLSHCHGIGSGDFSSGIYDCDRLSYCRGEGDGSAGFGIYLCTNVSHCEGVGSGESGYGFQGCVGVTYCAGVGLASLGEGFGFYQCKKMQQNKALAASSTATYNTSYADAGSANACADTAAGGYNS